MSKLSAQGLQILRRNETRLFSPLEALWATLRLGYVSIEEYRELRSGKHNAAFVVETVQQLSILALLAEGYDVWAESDLDYYKRFFNGSSEDGIVFYSMYAEKYMSSEDYDQVRRLWDTASRKTWENVRQMFAGFVLLAEGYEA